MATFKNSHAACKWATSRQLFDRSSYRKHRIRREQDEQVCSCGKRWPVGEDHP